MGISRDSEHKRRATGGQKKRIRMKRKFQLGRQSAMTKIGEKRISTVRCRGGIMKYRALRLETGNFAWVGEAVTRKTRIMSVVYNSSNNELVRTNTLVKGSIVQIDATPFKAWYVQYYNIDLSGKGGRKEEKKDEKKKEEKGGKKGGKKEKEEEVKKEEKKGGKKGAKKEEKEEGKGKGKKEEKKEGKKEEKKEGKKEEKKEGKKEEKKEGKKKEAKKEEKEVKEKEEEKEDKDTKRDFKKELILVPYERSKTVQKKIDKKLKKRVLEDALADQFKTGRIYAKITSRPGQVGRADGYVLEGEELHFYLKKLNIKKKK